MQVSNLYTLHRPFLFRFKWKLTYPCRFNYFCYTEFKATHTHVHTKHFWLQGYTSFCIQHCSLKTTLHITLVVLDNTRPIWSTFLSVLLLKFWTSSHCRAHISSVNTLSKICRPDYHGFFIPLCSIMEICWITTLHNKALHNLTASIHEFQIYWKLVLFESMLS